MPVLHAALLGTLSEAVGTAGAVRSLASLSNHAREEMAVRAGLRRAAGYSVDELGWALDAMAETDDGLEEPDASGTRGAAARGG